MKITALLLLISIMTVSAATNAQQITLKTKGASLDEVLDKVRQQTGYDVFYSNDILAKAKPVTVDLKNTPLQQAMTIILAGQNLAFDVNDQTVVIKEKERSLLDNLKEKVKELLANIDVRGRVVDEDGQPLPGATIIVKGGNNVTTTDANGYFHLGNVDPNSLLTVSFIGFDKQDIKAAAELGEIKMHKATSKLDEVQVIAYGQTTQRLSVGNVTTVSAKTISEQSVSNPLLALEGQVAGLNITQANGIQNGAVTVRIQGQNSLLKGNDPFYVIDGVPYFSQAPTAFPGGLTSPLSFIDPNNIESISVLKDADATAIYGSRAANGAILITTKKGKAGDTQVDINLQQGAGAVPHFVDMMNTQQYLQMRRQAFANDGLAIPSIQTTPTNNAYDINGLWDQSRYTDWQKALLGGTDHYSDFNATISGGSTNVQYLVGGTFHRETSVLPGDFTDRKGGLHFSLGTASNDQKFHLTLTGNYLIDNNNFPQTDPTQTAIQLPPDAPALYNPDGSLNWAPTPSGSNSWTNPLSGFLRTYQGKMNNLVSNLLMSYQLLPGLDITVNAGYNNYSGNEVTLTPLTAFAPSVQATASRASSFATSGISSWIVEPQVKYERRIGKGKFSALMGETINQSKTNELLQSGSGYNSDAVLGNIAAATSVTVLGNVLSTYKYNALFSRLGYSWNSKYILDLTARRDGSSRFGSANQFHDFWSAGAGWVFSEEQYVKNHFSFLTFGKLRASYGTTGNDQIGDYQYLSTYRSISPTAPYQGISALVPGGFANPYLQWELTRKFSAGMDLGFLKDRIVLNVTYSDNHSSNELLGYALPVFTGFSSITENFPATIRNYDWEFTANTTNITTKEFSWRTSLNLTVPRSELVSFPNLATSSFASSLIVGQPFVGILPLYHYLGVNPTTGVYTFAGANGATSAPNAITDQTARVTTAPTLYGGLQNSFSYKGLQLSFLLQYVRQRGPQFFGTQAPNGYVGYNQPVSVLQNSWTAAGQTASVQRYSTTLGSYYTAYQDLQVSDAIYGDDSYLRLKNASLSWTLPAQWSRRLHFKHITVYGQGQNLLTFTKYKGLDPESVSPAFATTQSLPPLRVITFGVKLGL